MFAEDDDADAGYEAYMRSRQRQQPQQQVPKKPPQQQRFMVPEDDELEPQEDRMPPPPRQPARRQRPVEEEEEEYDAAPIRMGSFKKPAAPVQKKPAAPPARKQTRFEEVEEEEPPVENQEEEEDVAFPATQRNRQQQEVHIIKQNGKSKVLTNERIKTVPFAVQQAARLLRDTYTGNVRTAKLMQGRLDDGLEIIAGKVCNLTVVDPYIVMKSSVRNGDDCVVLLKEVVPVSRFVLARLLKLRYGVPGIRGRAVYDDAIQLRPFKGVVSSMDAQPFGCVDAVEEALQNEYPTLAHQFAGYMTSLGPLSPSDVCDETWIEQTMDKFDQILAGTLVPIKAAPEKNEID